MNEFMIFDCVQYSHFMKQIVKVSAGMYMVVLLVHGVHLRATKLQTIGSKKGLVPFILEFFSLSQPIHLVLLADLSPTLIKKTKKIIA